MSQNILRIGLLLERYEVSPEEYKSLEKILRINQTELAFVAVSNRDNISHDSDDYHNRFLYLMRELLNNRPGVLVDVDFYLGKNLLKEESCIKLEQEVWVKKDIRDILETCDADIVEYSLQTSGDTNRYTVPNTIVKNFEELADVIVNFEHGILEGDILNATQYGVLSHHSSDIRKYRGRPAHIFQFINNEPTIGKTIQQLTPTLDGGKPALITCRDISKSDTLWDVKYKSSQDLPEMYSNTIKQILEHKFDPKSLSDLGQLTNSSDKQRWSVVARIIYKNWIRRFYRLLNR